MIKRKKRQTHRLPLFELFRNSYPRYLADYIELPSVNGVIRLALLSVAPTSVTYYTTNIVVCKDGKIANFYRNNSSFEGKMQKINKKQSFFKIGIDILRLEWYNMRVRQGS